MTRYTVPAHKAEERRLTVRLSALTVGGPEWVAMVGKIKALSK